MRDGRLDAEVEVRSARRLHGVDVCVVTDPGPRVTIGRVEFPGRTAVPADKLLAALPGNEAKVNRVGGPFDGDALESDRWYLLAEYWELGYAEVRMNAPSIRRHGNRVVLAIPIDEGPVYRIGKITTPIPLGVPLGIAPGEVFVRSRVIAARDKLAERLGAAGYVQPAPHYDAARRVIDLQFDIEWRWPWDALRFWHVPSR
jgi:outer membrane protein assembly factor BamA